MKKFFNFIKIISSHYTLFAATLVMSFLPLSVFAADKNFPESGLLSIANQKKWYSEDCPLGTLWGGKCIICPLFKALFDTASRLCVKAYDALHYSMVIIIAVATALWIALKILKYISGFEQIEPMKMVQELANQLFRSLIIILILSAHYGEVRGLTLDPIFSTGMNITQSLINNGNGCSGVGYSTAEVKGGLSSEMGDSLLCSIYMVEQKAIEVIDVGHTSFCLGNNDLAKKTPMLRIAIWPKWSYLISGALLILIGAVYLVGCPFLLLDCVINLCFAVTVMPLAIAGYAFKITSKYLKTVWDTFMSAMFNFLFMALIIYILNQAIEGIFLYPKAQSVIDTVASGKDGINSMGNLVHGIPFTGINFLKLAFIFLLGWSVLEKAGRTADEFAGAGMNPAKGMGSDMGKQMVHGMRRAGKGVASAAVEGAKTFAVKSGFSDWAKEKREQLKELNPIRIYGRSATHAAFAKRRADRRQERFDRKEAKREERRKNRQERRERRRERLNNSWMGKIHNSEVLTRARSRVSGFAQGAADFGKEKIGGIVSDIHDFRQGISEDRAEFRKSVNKFIDESSEHAVSPVDWAAKKMRLNEVADWAEKTGKNIRDDIRDFKEDFRDGVHDLDEALADRISGANRTPEQRAEERRQQELDKLTEFEKQLTDEEKEVLSQKRYGKNYRDLSKDETERLLKETLQEKEKQQERERKEQEERERKKKDRKDYRTAEEKARGVELSEEEWLERWAKDQRKKRQQAYEEQIAEEEEAKRKAEEEAQRLYDEVYGSQDNDEN